MKKILSLVLTAAMLATLCISVVMPVSAAASAHIITELNTAETLVNLGIFEPFDTTLYQQDTIKRSDLAVFIANCVQGGYLNIEANTKQIFTDVPASAPYARAVEIAYLHGIMRGDTDGYFNPNMSATFPEAAKCVASLLGYSQMAEEKGGYPAGYIMVASQIGLLRGIKTYADDFITLEDFSMMMYNALNVPLLRLTSIGGDKSEYTKDKDFTLLTEYFNLAKKSGIVEATPITALDNSDGLREGRVKINGVIYKEGESKASLYLGYYIDFYCTIDKNNENIESTIIYAANVESRNQTFTVDAEDITGIALNSDRSITLTYEQGKRTGLRVGISNNAYVIYNGKAWLSYDIQELIPLMGSITLLDNSNLGKYNIVFVEAFEDVIAGQITVNDPTVIAIDKSDPADPTKPFRVFLDPADSDYVLDMKKDDANITVRDLQQYDVLSVFESKNEGIKYRKVYAARSTVTGIPDEISEKTIVVGGRTYPLSKEYRNRLEQDGTAITFDANTFLLNFKNEITGIIEVTHYVNYGFIRGVSKESDIKDYSVRLWDIDKDVWKTVNIAKKLHIDDGTGERIATDTDIRNLEMKPVRFMLNASGEIYSINIPVPDADPAEPPRSYQLLGGLSAYGVNGSFTFYYFSTTTTAITIPLEVENYTNEKYYLKSVRVDDRATVSTLDFYDVEHFKVGLAIHRASARAGTGNIPVVVKKISSALDEDGEIALKIDGYQEGRDISHTLSEEATKMVAEKGIKPGDIVHADINSKGLMLSVELIHSAGSEVLAGEGGYGTGSFGGNPYVWNGFYVVGRVLNVDLSSRLFTVEFIGNDGNSVKQAWPVPGPILVNKDNRNFTSGSINDLQVGQLIVYHYREYARFIQIFDGV